MLVNGAFYNDFAMLQTREWLKDGQQALVADKDEEVERRAMVCCTMDYLSNGQEVAKMAKLLEAGLHFLL